MQTPDLLPEAEDADERIREDIILTTIWFRPTATLRYILAHCPDKYLITLMVLGGIARALDRAATQNSGDKMSVVATLLLAIIGGGLFGWITYYLYSVALSATGRWLGGRADWESFRVVLAWALVPSIVTLLLVLPQMMLFGDNLYKSEPVDESTFAEVMRGVFGLIELMLSIWALVILVRGVRLLQGFGVGRALLNIFLPGILLVGFIALFVGLFGLLTEASQT